LNWQRPNVDGLDLVEGAAKGNLYCPIPRKGTGEPSTLKNPGGKPRVFKKEERSEEMRAA